MIVRIVKGRKLKKERKLIKMTRGFTLIELLVVIAIVAVLAAAVVLVLNPAELIKQGRDATRLSDLSTIQSAISYYLSTASTPDTNFGATGKIVRCMENTGVGNSPFVAPVANGCGQTTNAVTSRAVVGTGWVAVKLDDASGGSPLGTLPVDPDPTTSDGIYFYGYGGDDAANTFELNGRLESAKYRTQMTSDGGDKNTCTTYQEATCYYEVGIEPGLDI